MKGKQNKHGGAREGAGNKPGSIRVDEKRKQVPLTILPSIIDDFKEKYGRGWSRRVEELIKKDLDSQA